MHRLVVLLIFLLLGSTAMAAGKGAPLERRDLYFGEALYSAHQQEWFDAIARLDTELALHHRLDQPELDSLFSQLGLAEFSVGDFELAYRMHRRAGRAITAVIEGKVSDEVRNDAIYRLARILFHKNRPLDALHTLERIRGVVPETLRDDLEFLRAQVFLAIGRFSDAIDTLAALQGSEKLKGFTGYNHGIALIRAGRVQEGREQLDRTGLIGGKDPVTLAIRDKANLVLGDKLLGEENFAGAKELLDRVQLSGPFSNRALLGSGWADASRQDFEHALVPWSLLAERAVTDASVQESLLAVPYAYGKLGVFSRAALLYGRALDVFGSEIDKLGASINSVREGRFLKALVRDELKQDASWVVRLRELPETPETYYLLELMASNDFQESLKNYLDLERLRKKLSSWEGDLDAYEEVIGQRRDYYEPLLPEIDRQFRRLDSQMRLRLEQRQRIEQRLKAMLVVPRPDFLATTQERNIGAQLTRISTALDEKKGANSGGYAARIKRLRGVLDWTLKVDYDRRRTATNRNLNALNDDIAQLNQRYTTFVRTRQAATQSYQGYDDDIRRLRMRIVTARDKVATLMARQGHLLESMAVEELSARRQRLEEFQVKARFAMADSYDRAIRAQDEEEGER